VLDRIAHVARKLGADGPAVEGIGIGAPGGVSWDRTTVTRSPNFPNWGTVNVQQGLTERLGFAGPIVVGNDANVAGLGSAFHGAGRAHDNFIMVTLGTGVGGAIIYQNKIFRGSTGGAGEIGHMTIDYEGPLARSGVAGAIEGYLGHEFIARHAQLRLLNEDTIVPDLLPDGDLSQVTTKTLSEAARKGDAPAIEVLAWAGHKLGCVLGSAINLLDIRTVVVGGGASAAGNFILQPARDTVTDYVTPALQDGIEIVQETLGNEAGILGAARLAFQHLDSYAPSSGAS
jgi:glucokinase